MRLTKFAFGLSTALLAAGAAFAQEEPQYGGTAIMGLQAEPSNLNPALSTDVPTASSIYVIFEGLVKISTEGTIEPELAESWEISDDGLTYTFHIREAMFHDGTPLTAEDVRYTLAEISGKYHPTFSSRAMPSIVSMEAPDDRTLVITLNEPNGPFLRFTSCSNGACIVPKHLFEGTDPLTNAATISDPVGTGPFKFVEWQRGSYYRAEKFADYWDADLPYLDGFVAQFIPNPATRTQAMINGDIDFVGMVEFPSNDLSVVDADPNVKLEVSNNPPNQFIGFLNMDKAPFDNVQVRHALMMATDRQYIRDYAFSGQGLPGTAPWTVQLPWAANEDVNYDEMYPFDTAAAAALLDEAGYPADADGKRMELSIAYQTSSPTAPLVASSLQSTWGEVGIEVTLAPTESTVLMPRAYQERNFDVLLMSYTSYGDPAVGIARIFTTESIGRNFGNGSGYSNPEVDEMFARAAKLTTLEERGEVYKAIMPILAEDLPVLTLQENKGFDVARKTLEGVWGYETSPYWSRGWLHE